MVVLGRGNVNGKKYGWDAENWTSELGMAQFRH
jgi:hypothetical protein